LTLHGFEVIWQAAPGAKPILSGGEQVTGWRLADQARGMWAAAAPAGLQTRQLYVDGTRAPIAQGAPPVALTQTSGGFTAASNSYASWRNPSGLEFVFTGGNGAWTQSPFEGSLRIEADIAEIRFYDRSGHLIGNP
jgi:hypothetical protein